MYAHFTKMHTCTTFFIEIQNINTSNYKMILYYRNYWILLCYIWGNVSVHVKVMHKVFYTNHIFIFFKFQLMVAKSTVTYICFDKYNTSHLVKTKYTLSFHALACRDEIRNTLTV